MAQLNLTLNQEEILALLADNPDEAFRRMFQDCMNSVLRAESAKQLGAERYERTDGRVDSRNGFRERQLNTRIGRITLQVPRHRNQPFKTMVFENYSRSEAALVAAMAEMVVNGVSSRKVTNVMETLCGTPVSKSAVSDVCKTLDGDVKLFRARPLTKEYPFLSVDATYFKVREDHRICGKSLMIAVGTTIDGKREILGFDVYPGETKETWNAFLTSLKERGLHGLRMVTSDAHEGVINAISRVFPDVPWQRCQTHFSRNVLDHAPKKYQPAIHAALVDMYNSDTIEEARRKRDAIINEYRDVAEKAIQCLENGFESTMIVMRLPKSMRRYFRTSNHLERLNKELKRRSNVIGVFPCDASLLRLMGSVLIEQDEKYAAHCSVRFSKSDAAALTLTTESLKEAAKEQHRLMAA